MRAREAKNGLTVQVIAGTHAVILGIDLASEQARGCLGFAIQRCEAGGQPKYLPNLLRFPSDADESHKTTQTNPLQKFRWGDYTAKPGTQYEYVVSACYRNPDGTLAISPTVTVTVPITTENPWEPGQEGKRLSRQTPIFFNRGAAASNAFSQKFPDIKTLDNLDGDARNNPEVQEAFKWLSNGLEEALLAFLGEAVDKDWALHGAVYEFQKPELLDGLKRALQRGVDVKFAYHHRKKNDDDDTWEENDKAIAEADKSTPTQPQLADVCKPRSANPQGAIMHNKFVVLLKRNAGGEYQPQAVWTGSTNWTDGGVYGQLNVGHAVYDADVAAKYHQYFEALYADSGAPAMRASTAELTPITASEPSAPGAHPIFSPQQGVGMLERYASISESAWCVMVCAPFELDERITKTFSDDRSGVARFLLLDKERNVGDPGDVEVIRRIAGDQIAVAAPLKSGLQDAQKRMLGDKESFRHAGVHIHSKIILADPFGERPILVTGSANYSDSSTTKNDSNSLIVVGDKATADIYATDFMRMWEHYHFRASTPGGVIPPLSEDDSWTKRWYENPADILDRKLFAGTLDEAQRQELTKAAGATQ